jgi:hypothetical protein
MSSPPNARPTGRMYGHIHRGYVAVEFGSARQIPCAVEFAVEFAVQLPYMAYVTIWPVTPGRTAWLYPDICASLLLLYILALRLGCMNR